MSRIVPVTGTEAGRTTQAAQIEAQEIHTTSDQQRLFVENRIVAPHWHGAVADQTAMLRLANRHSAATVSAAASDNSFNDSGAGFPGWIAGDILTVDGFTDPANNGVALTIVSRTASKIVVSGGTLVVEAAGATITMTKNGTPGCWPGDKCKRTDFGTIWECISNNGKLIGDWVEITTDRIGTIRMWSGTFANIPTGYLLCDGSAGTPNLSDKFIKGTTTEANIGNTGGNTNHTHAVGTLADNAASAGTPAGSIDAHTTTPATPVGVVNAFTGPGTHTFTGTPLGNHSHGLTGSTASTDGRPPYYELAFIKRMS